jgi:ATP-binding cassette subfamily B protein
MTPGMGVMAFNRALIRYGRRPFTVHAVLQIFYLGSRVLPGLIEKAVFDSITGQAALRVDIWALIAAYIGIGFARMVSTYAETFAGWTFRYVAGAQVRRGLFAALLRRPGALPHPISPGEAVNRYRTDVAEVCDFPTWLPDVAGNLVSFVAAVAIMASISWPITLVAFLPIVIAYGIGRTAWGRMLAYRKREGEAGDQVTGFLAEMFGAVQALKVAGMDAELNAVRHFGRLNDERRRTAVQARMLDTFVYSIHSFAVVVSTGVMLLMSSQGMIEGSFTVGDFALFTYFL